MNKRSLSLFFLCCAMIFGFSACKKNDPVSPVIPGEPVSVVKPGKAVWFVSPKTGQTLLYGALTEFRWAVNKDSAVKRVIVEVRQVEGGGKFKNFFEADADSLVKRVKVVFSVNTPYEFRIRAEDRLSSDTCQKIMIDGVAFGINWPIYGSSVEKASSVYLPIVNASGKNVAIDLSIDDGNHWRQIIYAGAEPKWFVQDGPAFACRLRMRTSDTLFVFISDVFHIVESPNVFRILLPTAGDRIDILSLVHITCQDSVALGYYVDISTDNGKTWAEIFEHDTPPKIYVKDWRVLQGPADSCLLRMRALDWSRVFISRSFQITSKNCATRYAILNINGGESFDLFSTKSVSFVDSAQTPYKMDVTTDNGKSWTQFVNQNSPQPVGTQNWFIAQGPSDSCRLKMYNSNPALTFITPLFRISDKNLKQTFAVTYPAGGEDIPMGSLVTVQTINTANLDKSFDYSCDNGKTWKAASFMNGQWFVTGGPGDSCYLRMKHGQIVVYSGRFRIVTTGLTEFFPLHPGMKFRYYYSIWDMQYAVPPPNFWDITITGFSDMGSRLVWTFTSDRYDTNNVYLGSSTGMLTEQKDFLGTTIGSASPFDSWVTIYHYLPSSTTEYSGGTLQATANYNKTQSYKMQRGKGLVEWITEEATYDRMFTISDRKISIVLK